MQTLRSMVRQRLGEVGMTQAEFAARIGMSASMVESLLSGRRMMKVTTKRARAIADALQCSVDDVYSAVDASVGEHKNVEYVSLESLKRLVEVVSGMGVDPIPMDLVLRLINTMNRSSESERS